MGISLVKVVNHFGVFIFEFLGKEGDAGRGWVAFSVDCFGTSNKLG